MYYIGIDGGGTYSRLVAVDEEGGIIGRHAGGSTNLSVTPYNTVSDNIKRLLMEFGILTKTKLANCKALCIGSAGVDTPEDAAVMECLLKELSIPCPVKAVSHAELILATAALGQPAAVVIAGTGSVAYATDAEGKLRRCGGWGCQIDDGGSGYWMGMEAIRAVLMAYDGRLPETRLTNMLKAHFGLAELSDIVKLIYQNSFNKAKIAELALLVQQAAEEGDEISKSIHLRAGKELYFLARALIRQYHLEKCKLVVSGSILLKNDVIRTVFADYITKDFPNVELVSLSEKPEMGAVYLAAQV